jgi:hypothetical protein
MPYLPSEEERPRYDIAEICQNGHVTNELTQTYPEFSKPFCDTCGARTTTSCNRCCQCIRGRMLDSLNVSELPVPAFCQYCGAPFPWTVSKLDAAHELIDELGLDIPEKTLLTESIEELVRNTPKAQAAAVRFQRLTENAKPLVMEGLRQVLYNVLSEPVRKMIWAS